MKTTLIDSVGTDLTVVNAARVSFNKESDWEYEGETYRDQGIVIANYPPVTRLAERDVKLIKYLAAHGHTSPFRHCFATFRVKAPVFVARQLEKHQVGMSWNEVSRRYVDSEPEFWWPEKWRKRAQDKKQGSSTDSVDLRSLKTSVYSAVYDTYISRNVADDLEKVHEEVVRLYISLLGLGVAPEQARMILPQNMYTEWYWSGSLQAWSHVCNLRCEEDTQQETREVALDIDAQCAKLWPYSWKALRNG